MSHKHLSLIGKYYIELERKSGQSYCDIAISLGRSQRTISREVKRNTGGKGYRHTQVTKFALAPQVTKKKSMKMTSPISAIIDEYLVADWNPAQIAGKLKADKLIELHQETIYQYILADKKVDGTLYTHLRHQGKT